MHNIHAIVTTQPINGEAAAELGLTVLEKARAYLVPLDGDHIRAWTRKLGIDDTAFIDQMLNDPAIGALAQGMDDCSAEEILFYLDHPTILEFARRLELTDFVLVYTELFGGTGGKIAICYQNGKKTLPPTLNYVNAALKMIGISRKGFSDEFEAAGLADHRSFGEFFQPIRK